MGLEVAFEKGKNFTYKEKREDSMYMQNRKKMKLEIFFKIPIMSVFLKLFVH